VGPGAGTGETEGP